MTLKDIANKLSEARGRREQISIELEESQRKNSKLQQERESLEAAQVILQEVARQVQSQLEYRIGELVSLALDSVFSHPYKLRLRFENRRGKTEADLLFVDDTGNEIVPMDSSGGGAVDVAAFALRVALWSLRRPRSKAVLILDEPFKHLKGGDANARVIQMVKEISTRLDLQIIMISDERIPLAEIEKGADRLFQIGIKEGRSFKSSSCVATGEQ